MLLDNTSKIKGGMAWPGLTYYLRIVGARVTMYDARRRAGAGARDAGGGAGCVHLGGREAGALPPCGAGLTCALPPLPLPITIQY